MGFTPELQEINRQREFAKMLLQKSMQENKGQMIGNRYVGASPWEHLAGAYEGYRANQLMKEADIKQAQLADLVRKGTAEDMIKFNELRYGQQGTPDVVPQGQTLRDDQGNLTYGAQQGVAAVPANPAEAYKFAWQSRFPQVNAMAAEMQKPQKLGEGERIVTFNPNTGKEEVVMQGGEKYHAPISVDTGTGTVLLDPRTMKPIATYGKSAAGHVLETDNGPVLVDTRTGKTTPITANGQPVTGGKALTETQSKASVFRSQMVGASNALNQLESNGFDFTKKGNQMGVSMAGGAGNILVTSEQQQAKQAQNQWTEAYLRFKTGAGTNAHEVEANRKTFFPQYGDTPDVIKQKAQMRAQAERDIGIAAGPRGATLGEQPKTPEAPSAQPVYAVNPQTNQRIVSNDGGKTWKPVGAK